MQIKFWAFCSWKCSGLIWAHQLRPSLLQGETKTFICILKQKKYIVGLMVKQFELYHSYHFINFKLKGVANEIFIN